MTERSKFRETLEINWKMGIYGFLFGLIFPLTAWILAFRSDNIAIFPLSMESLKIIHLRSSSLYLIDAMPLILGAIAYLLGTQMRYQRNKMTALIRHQSDNVSRLAIFAEKIGNGDFDANYDINSRNDNLGMALLDMREKLLNNKQQDANKNWIAIGRDKVATILRENNHIEELSYQVVYELVNYIGAVQGAMYLTVEEAGETRLKMEASYAYSRKKYLNGSFRLGEGLVGQAAIEQDVIHRTEIPDQYMTITSGILGDQKPTALLIVPLISEEKLQGAIELAAFERFSELQIEFVQELAQIIARTIYNLRTTERTEMLLRESQQMTQELREQQGQLEQNAIEMQAKQEEIEKTNEMLEDQIQAVRNSQKRQHALLENASEVITIYDREANVQYESPSIRNILGYDPEEMVGENDFSKADIKGSRELHDMFNFLIDNPGDTYSLEFSYEKKDGARIWMEAIGRNLLEEPSIDGIILNSRDITERKIAEEEQIMRGKMQALSENSQDIIIRFDLKGTFLYVNPMLQEYTNIETEQFVNHTLDEIELNQTIIESWRSTLNEIRSTRELVSKEMEFPSADQGDRVMQLNAIPEFNSDNDLDTVLVVCHDVTARKRQEVLIQQTNKKITDSINYAKRLQNAIVPDSDFIRAELKDSFIYYAPRDVVSGDFPYYYMKGEYIYLAAVDCTGHGVPGAMLSLIGFSVLNEILGHAEVYDAAQVLDLMHEGVVKTLKQDHEDNIKTADGMDVALVRIHKPTKEISYAGAHRPLYRVADGELQQYKGDRFPIGGTQYKKSRSNFTNHQFNYEEGESVYFFSDGMPDQFGGPNKMKYGPKRIREKILEHQDKPMKHMAGVFEREFLTWKGDGKQLDDILIIGIRF